MMKKTKTFNYKWQAKVYARWLWLKTILSENKIELHQYGYLYKYPDKKWSVTQIITTKNKK